MSLLFMDSFDDGLLNSKWTTNSAVVASTTVPRNGTHEASFEADTSKLTKSLAVADQHATLVLGTGLFQVAAADLATMTLFNFRGDTGTTVHLSLGRNVDGSLTAYRGGTLGGLNTGATVLASSGPNTILLGTWYHIEVKVFLNDATGTFEVRVNNTVVINFTGDTKNGGVGTVFDAITVGSDNPGTSINIRTDDFYLLNGAGAVNNNFVGDSAVNNLLPTGNGNYSQLVGSDADSIDNYLLVDEVPPNQTDYAGSGTVGNKDSYPVTDLPAAVTDVRGVIQRSWAVQSASGTRQARNFVRIAGADFTSADYSLGTGYLMYETRLESSPATAVAWTPAEVNGTEFGFETRTEP